ncbi:hypothetical protein V8G54_009577 [Vigna mungo]|uniref:Disease resistance protein At4g27190-like leucine-rich repeats domain-containing protein n=1 Tax=Vigna mungo TaxID=3915 RepID=A0AAQ3NVG4_VIGMU
MTKTSESTSNLSERDIQELCIGSRRIPNSNFSLLESLIVDGCKFISDVVLPFSLLPFLTNLETLVVRNCDFVKAIFDVKSTTQSRDVRSMGQTLPFSLKKLTVSKLPNLKNVWNEDPQVIISMHHLQEVIVEECEGLTSVFPASENEYLLKLESLVVKDCKGLMSIFAEDIIDPRTKLELMFSCPFVRSLELKDLPMFKYFYYCSLPCDNFAHLESHTENQVGTEKCMSVGENGMKMILRGEFERKLLESLKTLTLCFGSDVFPCKILEVVPNIEKVVVCDGSFKKMFCCESDNNVLQQLKVLRLEYLEELVSIGLENSWTDSFVRNLETFEVINCSSLKNLVGCTVSFSNLTCLKVEDCDSLSYLLTSSAAKRLGQLKRMEIKDCDSIEEIVYKEDGEESDEDEIIFPQLTCLNLHWLRSLKRFYKGSLGFPSLEELSVTYCDEMITLCEGSIEAGKLSQVKLDPCSDAIQLETNLNSILWEKYIRKVCV